MDMDFIAKEKIRERLESLLTDYIVSMMRSFDNLFKVYPEDNLTFFETLLLTCEMWLFRNHIFMLQLVNLQYIEGQSFSKGELAETFLTSLIRAYEQLGVRYVEADLSEMIVKRRLFDFPLDRYIRNRVLRHKVNPNGEVRIYALFRDFYRHDKAKFEEFKETLN